MSAQEKLLPEQQSTTVLPAVDGLFIEMQQKTAIRFK
jgi:hypothetical protein